MSLRTGEDARSLCWQTFAGAEPSAGARERSRRDRDSLSWSASRVSRTAAAFYGEERGKRRGPFPRAPIPEIAPLLHSAAGSSMATRLAANENTSFFLGLVKPQPGEISIV